MKSVKRPLSDFGKFEVKNALAIKGGDGGTTNPDPNPPAPPIIIIDDSIGRG